MAAGVIVPLIRALLSIGGIFGRGAATGAARGAATSAARGAATGAARGKAGVLGKIFGVGSGFLGGLFSGATGGKLGDSRNNNSSNSGTVRGTGSGSFFGISNSSSTKINVPSSSKDECCAQTIALLSSIDETLKRSLYISQRLASQNSEIMAEGRGNQNIAGLGGGAERLRDDAEKTGYGLGQMIMESAGLFILTNAGKLFDLGKEAFDGAASIVDGINKTIDDTAKSPLISPVIEGIDTVFKGGYQAKTEEGKAAGPWGGIVGGALTGMAIGAAGGSVAPGIGNVVGAVTLGILGAIMGEDAFEVLGDTFSNSFNENVDSDKIGKEIGESFLSKTKNKIDLFTASVAPDHNSGGSPRTRDMSGVEPKSLGDLIAKYESGGNANIYNKYDPSSDKYVAVRNKDISSMSVNDIMKEQSTRSMFAVGKYQYTPDTLKDIIDRMKEQKLLSGNERFTEDLQNKIFSFSIMNDKKFENLRKYLSGDVSAKKAAMLELAKEWRALPDPNTGRTFADKGERFNKALVSTEEVSKILDKMLPSSGSMPLTSPSTEGSAAIAAFILSLVGASSPMPLVTPRTNTGEIDYFAIRNQLQKYAQPGQNTVMLPTSAPIMQTPKTPPVPYPVDGPRLMFSTSQFPLWRGWPSIM